MHATDPVNRIMSEPVLTIDIDAPVQELLQMFVAYPVHHLPVVKEGAVVGMLSSADIMKLEFFLPPPGAARNALLAQRFRIDKLMRAPVVTVGEHESVQRAAELMAKHGIHSLPVMNRQDRMIGIVTTTDLMQGCLRSAPRSAESSHLSDGRFASAMIAARVAIDADGDKQGIAAALLHSQQRLSTLEAVLLAAKRYLNAGQDERLHTALAVAIERADLVAQQAGRPALLGVDVGE